MIDNIPDKHTLVQLIDDCAAILQNPTYYGVVLRKVQSGGNSHPGIPFRNRVMADLARLSPAETKEPIFHRNTARGSLLVPIHIVRKANEILRKRGHADWPEDEWYSVTPDWDLNLYIEPGDVAVAAIYSVVDGRTRTGRFWETYRTGGWG